MWGVRRECHSRELPHSCLAIPQRGLTKKRVVGRYLATLSSQMLVLEERFDWPSKNRIARSQRTINLEEV
jgi:hypothetical protein